MRDLLVVRMRGKASACRYRNVCVESFAMEEDLIEPGSSSKSAERADDVESSAPPPLPEPAATETENKASPLAIPDAKSTWTSPAERAAIAMSKRRQLTRMKPSTPYVTLSCVQTALGAVIVGVGGAAFAITPSFRAGCFWAGLVVLLLSTYSLILLCLKLTFHKSPWFRKCKRTMYHIHVGLCILCILITITAAILDILSAYMLYRTNFSRCLHTNTRLAIDCDTEICSDLKLPPNTCYCCYLYHDRKAKGCGTPFLLDKSAYFVGVDSCGVLAERLYPMVTTVGLLCLLSTALNIVFLFKSRPVRYYVKSEEEEEEEEEEGEVGFVGKIVQKLKPKRAGKRGYVRYAIASTEDTTDSTA